MIVLNLVFLILLAESTTQSGIPQYVQGQWIIPDEDPQYEDFGLAVEGNMWPASPPEVVELVTEGQSLPTTPEPQAMKEEDPNEGKDSSVWKVVLIVAVLLVSIVGCLSVAYYMCVWRGGRIHYKLQNGGYA